MLHNILQNQLTEQQEIEQSQMVELRQDSGNFPIQKFYRWGTSNFE
jgi:hypothetical protein